MRYSLNFPNPEEEICFTHRYQYDYFPTMSSSIPNIRQRVLNRELMSGTFLNLGSSISVEIAGRCGFDWFMLDLEHGSGNWEVLGHQMQALNGSSAAPIVRVIDNQPPLIKRALDIGASGIMVPWVGSAEEAKRAVASMRYPPEGIRGAAGSPRAAGFGMDFKDYFSRANKDLLAVIQIERKGALECVDEIAAVDGVDVLFIGPLDLSISLGIPLQFDHPLFLKARRKVVEAANRAGKAAGITIPNTDQLQEVVEAGFTFLAIGRDTSLITQGMRQIAAAQNSLKSTIGHF